MIARVRQKLRLWSFFFKAPPAFGVAAYCAGQKANTAVSGVVVAARKLDPGETWINTELQRVVSWEVVEMDDLPFKILSVDTTKKILASSTDTITEYKNTVLDCDEDLEADKIYICALLPGKIIDSGNIENCYIHSGESVQLAIDGECCE